MSEAIIPEGISFSCAEHRADVLGILQDRLHVWSDFPLAQLHQLSDGNSLLLVSWFALHKSGLISCFGINGDQLLAFLREVQGMYRDNPYHCAMHAADVTQGTYSLMCACGLFQSLPPIEALALLVSAIVHDVDHPGVNNLFLVNSQDPLAFAYNDTSVLENHHLVTAFTLLQRPQLQWTGVLSQENKATLRRCMIKNILHTDMALHKSGLQQLMALPDTCREQPSAFATWAPDHRQVFNQVPVSLSRLFWSSFACSLVLQHIPQSLLHLADLGASLRNFQSSMTWGLRITQEFFAQGDRELALGLPVSPMNARDQPPLSKSQVYIPFSIIQKFGLVFVSRCLQPGFIQHMVMPLCDAMSQFRQPIFQELLDNGRANMQSWADSCVSVPGEPPRKKSR